LEVLRRKPGALPGATALAQARAAGTFTAAHQGYWDAARRRHGDAAGTRALIEVLLAHRTLPAAAVEAAMTRATASGVLDPQPVPTPPTWPTSPRSWPPSSTTAPPGAVPAASPKPASRASSG